MIDIIVRVFHAMTASDWGAILALAGLFLLAGYMPRILEDLEELGEEDE